MTELTALLNCVSFFASSKLAMTAVALEYLYREKPDTVRGTMYGVVHDPGPWLPDTSDKSYARLDRALVRLRENFIMPADWLRDAVRSTVAPMVHSCIADYASEAHRWFRQDPWIGVTCPRIMVQPE